MNFLNMCIVYQHQVSVKNQVFIFRSMWLSCHREFALDGVGRIVMALQLDVTNNHQLSVETSILL